MSDFWNDAVGWRDAMLPPLTFAEALKAARRAKAASFTWRGSTFDLGAPGAVEPRPQEPPSRSLFKLRAVPKQKVVL
jgi:hypothetical protein